MRLRIINNIRTLMQHRSYEAARHVQVCTVIRPSGRGKKVLNPYRDQMQGTCRSRGEGR